MAGVTFALLQPADLLEERLQVHVEPVAAAEQLEEVAGAEGAARVVHELPGRRQPVWEDLKPLPLRETDRDRKKERGQMVRRTRLGEPG